MIHVDAIAYQSKFKHIMPKTRIALTLILLIVGVTLDAPILFLINIAIASLVVLFLSKAKFTTYLKLMAIPMMFIGFTSILIAPERIFFALNVCLRSLSSIMLIFSLSLTVPIINIVDFLKFLRLPAAFVHLFALSYRMIFVTIEIALDMVCANQLRFGFVRPTTTFKSVAQLGSMLFLRLLNRASEMEAAMSIRFYDELGVDHD